MATPALQPPSPTGDGTIDVPTFRETSVPKIVVLTPVKNEAWILERFLSVTSQFADCIVMADQSSTDGSVEIAKRYKKVILLKNEAASFNEAERQKLLIDKARELVPGPKILLALDADEIFAADAVQSLGWQTMLRAKPGTILWFERPELYLTTRNCLRFPYMMPLGFVDDGSEHRPLPIHSTRVPTPEHATSLKLHDVKVLHYNFLRMEAHRSKIRRYCAVERVQRSLSWPRRAVQYRSDMDWSRIGRVEKTQDQWFHGWAAKGLDMHSVIDAKFYHHDLEVLRLFKQYGSRYFYWDDIWQIDWESCRRWAEKQKLPGIPEKPIAQQPRTVRILLYIAQRLCLFGHKVWIKCRGWE